MTLEDGTCLVFCLCEGGHRLFEQRSKPPTQRLVPDLTGPSSESVDFLFPVRSVPPVSLFPYLRLRLRSTLGFGLVCMIWTYQITLPVSSSSGVRPTVPSSPTQSDQHYSWCSFYRPLYSYHHRLLFSHPGLRVYLR